MQKIKSMIKKIGAISTGVAFLGATITGALAADLKDYPAPFVNLEKKQFDYLGVVGAGSAAIDNLGLNDVTAGLQAVKVPGTSTGGTVSVSGGETEDVPVGDGIAATNQLDKELTDADLSHFLDGTISFQGSDYDVSEVLLLGGATANVSIQSSIGGNYADDDYEDRVVMVASTDSVKYYYKFDESIQLNKTKSSDALDIKFLGTTLKITSIDSASKFTANVGAEYYLQIEDTVTVLGKEVKLLDVGSGGNIIVTVDGVQDVVSADSTKTINGVEVKNDDTFYTDNKAERSAWLVIGKDATESYTDGDAYVGEDEDDPKWVWDIGNLNTVGTTGVVSNTTGFSTGTGPFIGLENDWNYRDGSDSDALEVGGCIDLPNNYVSICLDSLTVADDNYMGLTIELSESVDLTSDSKIPGLSTANTIHVKSDKSDSLRLLTSGLSPNNLSKNTDTNELWLTGSHNVSVFYKDKDLSNRKTFAGNVSGGANSGALWAELRFDDTKDTNLRFNATRSVDGNANDGVLFTLHSQGDTTTDLVAGIDDLYINWSRSSGGISTLGNTKSSEEAGELRWGLTQTNLGTKDEDHRTKYGVVVKDPKSNGASDRVELMLPGDQVMANVVVKGSAAVSTGGVSTGISITSYDTAPSAVLDTEVTTPKDHNLLLVGGPAVNRLSAQFLGLTYPAFGTASGLQQGEAIISLKDNDGKVALIVAGWEGEDTRRASAVLKNYEAYKGQLMGSEVKVSGTTAKPTVVSSA